MKKARDFVKGLAKDKPPFQLHCVGEEATKEAIRTMGTAKAVGVDGLPCPRTVSLRQKIMINSSILTGTYPTMFKDAIVIPVFKAGKKDKLDPASYRPVSVLPALSKVLEAIVVKQFLRKKLLDKVRVEGLMKKSELESINSMVCSASAMLAWRASKASSPLHGFFKDMMPLCNTRSKAAGKLEVPAPNTKNLALWNMAVT